MKKNINRIIKKYNFLLIILLISSLFMLLNLNDRLMWGDEVYTAMYSKNTLKYKYPKAYDGENIICSDFKGESCIKPFSTFKKESYIFIYNPWLENYVMALSLLLFGFNNFAARLPFAIFGLASLAILYFFSLKLTKDKKIANLSIFLLAFYIPFYLYSRTARYHSLTMFLSILAIYFYLELLENRKRAPYLFIVSLISLFYTHYIPFFATYAAIIFHFFMFKFNKNHFKKLIYSSISIFCFTFPWFLYVNLAAQSAGFGLLRVIKGIVYLGAYFSLYVIPFVFYLFFPKVLYDKNKKKEKFNKHHFLILFLIFFGILMTIFGHSILPSFRYITFLFPFSMIIIAKIILNIKTYSKYLAFITIVLLIFSNYLFILPFKPFEKPILNKFAKDSDNYLFVKESLSTRYLIFDYLHEITHHYSTSEEKIIDIIKTKYTNKDVIITNFGNELYMFYFDVIMYRTVLNKSPDWIILREPYNLWGDEEYYNFTKSFINDSYRKITLNATDYIYPVDSPNPRTHRFRENKYLTESDKYPYETYPIEIYHLVK